MRIGDGQIEGEVFLGRYRVEAQLGEGGMSTIWQCTDLVSGRQVAVKLVDASAESGRALLEGEAMAAIRHPCVVELFDFGLEVDRCPCLVMELIPGEGLRQHLDQVGTLAWQDAFSMGAHVLDGLAAVHGAGFIHRDVKPANIMLPNGVRNPIKLIDLGIATPAVPSNPRLTQNGTVIGTPAYMAPEVLMGLTPKVGSDIYSLGVVLWEAICGRSPRDEGLHHARAKLSFVPDFESLPSSAVVPWLARRALGQMLRPQIDDRPDDAQECATLLRTAIANVEGSIQGSSTWEDTLEIEIDVR